jgi:hypothetical protein
MIYSLAANAMIENIGLEWTFRTLAIISCAVNVVCSLLLKDRNKHVSASLLAFDVRLLKRPEFWLLLGYGFFSVRTTCLDAGTSTNSILDAWLYRATVLTSQLRELNWAHSTAGCNRWRCA